MEMIISTDLTTIPADIDFNDAAIKAELAERLEYYKNLVVTEDTIKGAKADKAKLRKLREAVETRRKEIKSACLAPYNRFEVKVKEIVAMIDEPIEAIDSQLSFYEEQRKAEKLNQISEQYAAIISDTIKDIIPLDRIMDKSWLNVSMSAGKIEQALIEWKKRVCADLIALDTVDDEHQAAVRQKYIETLDVGAALAHRDTLRAAEQAFKARDEQAHAAETKPAAEPESSPEQTSKPDEKLYSLTLRFSLTRDQAVALKQFLTDNNIQHQKIA